MTYEIIQNLVEKFSCDIVMADPSEPETLSSLLPVLKQIHGKCMELSLNAQAKEVLKARKVIKRILDDGASDGDEKMTSLNTIVSGLSSSIYAVGESSSSDCNETSRQEPDSPDFEKLEALLEDFSGLVGGFCPGAGSDIEVMSEVLRAMITEAETCEPDAFVRVAGACMAYIENMIRNGSPNTKPIDDAMVLLRALLRYMKRGDPFIFETADVMEILKSSSEDSGDTGSDMADVVEDEKTATQRPESEEEKTGGMEFEKESAGQAAEPEKISDDDMEILADFVSEALDSLESIEILLVELEQDPTDKDIINNIFRPFHTIKGISGFLALEKINKLSHTTENLLDAARNNEFLINDIATNAILESVDTLKALIARVEQGIEQGIKHQDDDIDVDRLRDKLQNLQAALTKGESAPLGEILVDKGVISNQVLDDSLAVQQQAPDKKIGEILVEEKQATPEDVASALKEQQQTPGKRKLAAQVKVSTEKLDDLVDYAGELVIAQAMLRQKLLEDPSMSQSVSQLNLIVSKIQNIAMSMRMIPIKATFMKMIRLVRDLSQKSGKQVALNMSGEDTEIDRNVVDALYEPMVHMIRNSVDHGIESVDLREQSGKPSKGTIDIRAYHKGGHIIIEIEDDGKGLDKEVILEKAVKTGLTTRDANLTDAQIYDMILQPGFSTAQKITEVSGRGVGMDVVKEGIEKFRGHLNIESSKGRGTKFTISLPLTLAIIDGMLVRVGDEKYVIPTIAIERAFKPEKENCYTVEGKAEMLKERDELIPLIRLKKIYGGEEDSTPPWEGLVVVVESKDEKRGLLIDELLGKDEFVIKSLGANLEGIPGLSGGAILSDGRVGLILDVQGLFKIAAGE